MTDYGPQERLYLKYKLRFAEDFDWVLGGKLPGFAGGRMKAEVTPIGADSVEQIEALIW
jgi:hypothetical protein